MKPPEIFYSGFETRAISMRPYWRVRFSAPADEIDVLFDEIIKVAPLVYGKTDRNAIRAAPGHEYYRPLEVRQQVLKAARASARVSSKW